MDKGKLLFLGQLPFCFGVWVKGRTIRKGMENDSQGKERRRVIWKKKKQEGVSWRQAWRQGPECGCAWEDLAHRQRQGKQHSTLVRRALEAWWRSASSGLDAESIG